MSNPYIEPGQLPEAVPQQPPFGAAPAPATYPPGYHPQPARSGRWGKIGGGAAAGAGIAAKAGLFAKLLLVFKSAALLVKFKFAGTMALSLVAYIWIYGWAFGVGLVVLLAIHEFGHVAAFRMQGVKASLPTFVPFLGAYVKAETPVRSVAHGAAVALAGPAAGTVAGLGCFELSRMVHSPVLQVLGYFTFFMSFINLLPLWILDGAKVVRVLHPAVFFAALGAGVVFEISHPTRMMPFLLILGGVRLNQRRKHHAQWTADYHATPPTLRSWIGAGYIGVALICLWGMNISYIPR